jgi:hypothetical protein
MIGKNKVSKALDKAFRAAFMLTGSTQAAEHAVLDGIAATEFDSVVDDVFLLETVKAAIHRRPDSAHQSQQPRSRLPLELRRLFLLAPISRDCFVLRILLGIAPRTCSGLLHLTIEESHEALWAALEALPFLEAGNSGGTPSIPLGERARPLLTARTVMKNGSNSNGT